MNTVYWPLSWAVIIFIGAVLLLVIWWVISEYGASKEKGRPPTDPRSRLHQIWEDGYLAGWRDAFEENVKDEHGKTRQQVQAQAPQQAVKQTPPGERQEQGITLRPPRDPEDATPESSQGQEEGQAHDQR